MRNPHDSTKVQWRGTSPTFVINSQFDIALLRRRIELFAFLVAHLADHPLHLGDFAPPAHDIPHAPYEYAAEWYRSYKSKKHELRATATINPKTAEKHKRDARKEDYDKPSQSGKQSIQD